MMCRRLLTVCVLSLSMTAFAADIEIRFDIPALGPARVVYTPARPPQGDNWTGAGELVFRAGSLDAVLLRTTVDVNWLQPHFDLLDVNADGYPDVIFYRQQCGFGGSPTRCGDVYMYLPRLRTFARSATLSDRGELSRSKRKGCVDVQFKSGASGYTDETWCFHQGAGRWRLVKSTGGEPTQE